jgi:hypothetical protein
LQNTSILTNFSIYNRKELKMAATDSTPPVINVLFTFHPGMEIMDFAGPLSVLSAAQHVEDDPCKFTILLKYSMPLSSYRASPIWSSISKIPTTNPPFLPHFLSSIFYQFENMNT